MGDSFLGVFFVRFFFKELRMYFNFFLGRNVVGNIRNLGIGLRY